MHKIKGGKFQTGNTFPKQYWLAVNDKPKIPKVSTDKLANKLFTLK